MPPKRKPLEAPTEAVPSASKHPKAAAVVAAQQVEAKAAAAAASAAAAAAASTLASAATTVAAQALVSAPTEQKQQKAKASKKPKVEKKPQAPKAPKKQKLTAAEKKAAAAAVAAETARIAALVKRRVVNHTPKKFDVLTAEGLRAGVANLKAGNVSVFSNVATADEVKSIISKYWDYMEAACEKLKRDDPDTWTNKRWPGILGVGILKYYGIGQSAFMYAVRTLPRIRVIYEALYATDKLFVSFDSCGAIRGAEYPVAFNHSWLHVDQTHDGRPGVASYQGALNLVPIGAETADHGSFLYIPKSAAEHKQRFDAGTEEELKGKRQYCKLPTKHYFYKGIDKGTHALQALANLAAGDFFMWRSDMVHAARMPTSTEIQGELRRLVAYVTMSPFTKYKSGGMESAKALAVARRAAAKNAFTTGHWPCEAPVNNHFTYPRCLEFQPVVIPPVCYKTTFTAAEAALVDGTSPSSSASASASASASSSCP